MRQESNRLRSTSSWSQVHSSRRPGHPYGAYRQGWRPGGPQEGLQEDQDKDQAVRAARGGLIATTVGVDLASVAGRASGCRVSTPRPWWRTSVVSVCQERCEAASAAWGLAPAVCPPPRCFEIAQTLRSENLHHSNRSTASRRDGSIRSLTRFSAAAAQRNRLPAPTSTSADRPHPHHPPLTSSLFDPRRRAAHLVLAPSALQAHGH